MGDAALADGGHFRGCHPDDDKDRGEVPAGYKPASTENCWHCGTTTPHGCDCSECWRESDYVPPAAVYHCPLCGRWWAWMTGLNIITITFGGDAP